MRMCDGLRQDNLEQEDLVIVLLSTWDGGHPPARARTFFAWLKDMALDFRVSRTHLSRVRYAVFGLGNKEYDEDFCTAAVHMDKYLRDLGAVRLHRCVGLRVWAGGVSA